MGSLSFGGAELLQMYNARKASGGTEAEPLIAGWFKLLSDKAGSAWFELAAPDEIAQGR